MSSEPQPLPVKFPPSTIFAVVAAVALVKLAQVIAPLFLPLLIAIFLAVALAPILKWLCRKGLSRGLSLFLITTALSAGILVLLSAVAPSLYREAASFIENLPQFREDMLQKVGAHSPLHGFISHIVSKEFLTPTAEQLRQLLGAGNFILGGLTDLFLILVLAIYLLADGPKVIQWIRAYFSEPNQAKIDQTSQEVSKIISAYIFGQFVTSALSFLFVLICLSFLNVPNTVLLAALAGILDVLPVLGFVLAVVPAMLFALNVSTSTCWIVFALYVFYHLLENYLIIPLVYGSRMRVSSLVVFVGLLAAWLVGGIEGAIVALPIVASYPIVERIWLKPYLRSQTIAEHTTAST